jgi:protein SCO1/2
MDRNRRRLTYLALNALGVASVPLAFSTAATRVVRAAPVRPATGSRERMSQHFPNLWFVTQDGRRVRFYDDIVKGRKLLINFMYIECSRTCPRTTANLVRVQRALGDRVGHDVFMVSITLAPERDSAGALSRYAREHGCGPGWVFLTGTPGNVNRVRRSLGLYDTDDIRQHAGILTYGNESEGKWGATPILARPEHIAWLVTSRIDPWVARPWPSSAKDTGAPSPSVQTGTSREMPS